MHWSINKIKRTIMNNSRFSVHYYYYTITLSIPFQLLFVHNIPANCISLHFTIRFVFSPVAFNIYNPVKCCIIRSNHFCSINAKDLINVNR